MKVAIIGAGPAGLMAAEVIAAQSSAEVHVFEQKPSAARKFLMAGKTGLNISHAEPLAQFIQRYDQAEWLAPWIERWDAQWIQNWMHDLGIQSYIGSSGRIFPVEMKAAPLLRAWLNRLHQQGVKFHYRHQVLDLQDNQLKIRDLTQQQPVEAFFDAIVLACGAVSWSRLGSDGAWQQWLDQTEIEPFQGSNAGVLKSWSRFMQPVLGLPLKRVKAWVKADDITQGDIVITHYGLESGLIYKHGRALREQWATHGTMHLQLDLLPELREAQLAAKLQGSKKQSLNNLWRKAGLDQAKAALLREVVDKAEWHDAQHMATRIKTLSLKLDGFRPIEEAISCAGGIRQSALNAQLQLKLNPHIFCCGEMLDWDAPTGGYLLTACFATGRAAGVGVVDFLQTRSK